MRFEERISERILSFCCLTADFALVFSRFTASYEGKNGENAPCGVSISLIGCLDRRTTQSGNLRKEYPAV